MNPPSALYTGSAAAKVTRRCCITGFQMGLNGCHLVPKNQGVWWANNEMRLFASSTVGELGDEANQVLLRADVHVLLDNHHFTIVPKPSPSGLSSSHAFATHVLKDDDESREFRDLYHNISLAQTAVDRIRPEFLFVRFAWAIFSHLQTFISSPARRHLAVTLRNETGPGSCITNTKMMNGREVNDFLTSRGLTRSGSRKRSSSQVTQDEWDVGTEDIYQERWERRSRQFSDANTSFDYLDPETSRIRDNTQWYDEVGQFSRARDFRQEQIERNSRWYERNFEQHSEITATEVPEADDYNECDDIDLERGRDVERDRSLIQASGSPDVGSSPPDKAYMPKLSRSFTSHGSNRSSTLLELVAHNEDELYHGLILDSSTTGDKATRVGRMGRELSRTYESEDDTVSFT
jgi:hypothetical protein